MGGENARPPMACVSHARLRPCVWTAAAAVAAESRHACRHACPWRLGQRQTMAARLAAASSGQAGANRSKAAAVAPLPVALQPGAACLAREQEDAACRPARGC
eukprot:292481-Chlamydomonas_euryale.AAC.7